jgi:flavin reductase (DIM6/NTAB) family NADH-FMN oxidoreductase RutF
MITFMDYMKVDLPVALRMDFPLPVVVVSCSLPDGSKPNLITVSAVSGACHDPPMWGVAIGHSRHSYGIMAEGDSFVINVPSKRHVGVVEYCGSHSGRKVDKFKECGLMPMAHSVSSPCIREFPLNIECSIAQSVDLGGHEFFFGEIKAVQAHDGVLNGGGGLNLTKLSPVTAFQFKYYELGERVRAQDDPLKSTATSTITSSGRRA